MRWKSHAKAYDEALVYMKKRQQGLVQSLVTPWPKINDAGINGFEWNSVVIIAARPGGGKTLMLQQLERLAFKLNKGQNIRVLDFQLEMVGRNSKIREFSSVSKESYKYLCSAEKGGIVISDELIAKCAQYAQMATKYPIDIIEDSVTAEEFELEIREYMAFHATKDALGVITGYKKTIVSLDHSVLLKKMKGQSTIDKLNALGEAVTRLSFQSYSLSYLN
jgi:replicative DNA helicase